MVAKMKTKSSKPSPSSSQNRSKKKLSVKINSNPSRAKYSNKYQEIIENIREGLYEIDLKGNYVFVNDAVCRVLGYSKKALLRMNSRQFTDESDVDRVFHAYNNVYKTGRQVRDLVWQITRKDGTKRLIEGSISLLKNASGKPVGFRGIAHDITERIKNESQKNAALGALRKSEKFFREVTENSSDMLVILDKAASIKYCSLSVKRFTGYPIEELIGKNVFQFLHPDERKRAMERFGKAILENDVTLIPDGFRMIHKDGAEMYIEGLGKNLLTNPDIAGFIINVRDVTEQKKAEKKLREEQERFRALSEQSSEVILLVNRDGKITYENPAIENALGFKPYERIGASAFSLVHPDDIKIVTNSFSVLFEDKNASVQKAEIRLRHKDGHWKTFMAVASNLKHENNIEYAIVNLHDITERKMIELALHESKQKYKELSIVDDLTQLYNSRHFHSQLNKEIIRANRYEQPLTLFLMDLDNFKLYNDTYGHIEGDNLLSRLGRIIKRCLRNTDSAYRYGGEEFTIILPMTTNDDGILIAERIQTELSKENFSPVSHRHIHVTMSIGISQYKLKEDAKEFVYRVDKLMYRVKNYKKGKIFSDNEIMH